MSRKEEHDHDVDVSRLRLMLTASQTYKLVGIIGGGLSLVIGLYFQDKYDRIEIQKTISTLQSEVARTQQLLDETRVDLKFTTNNLFRFQRADFAVEPPYQKVVPTSTEPMMAVPEGGN